MNSVLEEVTSDEITKEHVVKRVDDWVDRLNGLYDLVANWLPPEWHADRRRSILMDEKMMQLVGVVPREIPVLELRSDDGRRAFLEPRGLWIIGTNGRVDLVAGSRHHLIFDFAKNFATPDWQIDNFFDRKKPEKLGKTRLAAALAP